VQAHNFILSKYLIVRCKEINFHICSSHVIIICSLRLFQVSSRMKDQLLEASEMQGMILNSQKEGLRIQNELLDHGQELETILQTSSETVSNMVSDFK